MRVPSLSPWMLLVLAAVLLPAADAEAMRCAGRVVSGGDHAFQVRERCGEPDWVERSSELHVSGALGPRERRAEVIHESWYYNRGPNQLVRRLVFADGRLQRIETAGHGHRRDVARRCTDSDFTRGASSGEIALRCGAPDQQSSRYRDEILRAGDNALLRPRRYEEWIYAGGSGQLGRLLVFEDDRLSQVRTLPR